MVLSAPQKREVVTASANLSLAKSGKGSEPSARKARHDVQRGSEVRTRRRRSMAGSRIDLEVELDRLFALRPQAFVAARDALAARLRASGDPPEAGRIKALKRPSVPAWAVNQLRFEAPRVLAALLASADRVRSRPSDMPDAVGARRKALAEARKKAAEVLVAGGHPATPQTMQRVSSTLEALATYGNAPDRGVAGRLTEELPAPGFDDLAALGILRAAAAAESRLDRRKQASSQAPASAAATTRHRIEEKESRANRAREVSETKKKEAERARAALLEAQGRAETLRQKREELKKALAEAERQERAHAQEVASAREAARKGRARRQAAARALFSIAGMISQVVTLKRKRARARALRRAARVPRRPPPPCASAPRARRSTARRRA